VYNIQYSVFKWSSELPWASVLHALLTWHVCQSVNFNLLAWVWTDEIPETL